MKAHLGGFTRSITECAYSMSRQRRISEIFKDVHDWKRV